MLQIRPGFDPLESLGPGSLSLILRVSFPLLNDDCFERCLKGDRLTVVFDRLAPSRTCTGSICYVSIGEHLLSEGRF